MVFTTSSVKLFFVTVQIFVYKSMFTMFFGKRNKKPHETFSICQFQDHAYDVLGSSNIGPNQNSTQQYRPADHLISHIIDVLEQWISRRPQLANHETDLLLSPISVVPIFVSKWIDYSNKYGFGYQLSDKTVGVLFNEVNHYDVENSKFIIGSIYNYRKVENSSTSPLIALLSSTHYMVQTLIVVLLYT